MLSEAAILLAAVSKSDALLKIAAPMPAMGMVTCCVTAPPRLFNDPLRAVAFLPPVLSSSNVTLLAASLTSANPCFICLMPPVTPAASRMALIVTVPSAAIG